MELDINTSFLGTDPLIKELWGLEKRANLEAIKHSKDEALTYLSQERETILQLSHQEAIRRLLVASKVESKIHVISNIADNKLLSAGDK